MFFRFKFSTVTSGDFQDFFIEFFTSIWDPLSSSSLKETMTDKWVGEEGEIQEGIIVGTDMSRNDISNGFVSISDTVDSISGIAVETGITVVKYITELISPPSSPKSSKIKKNQLDSTRLREEAKMKLSGISWCDLFHSKGMPLDPIPSFDNILAEAAEALALKWIKYEMIIDANDKSGKNIVYGVRDDLKVRLDCIHTSIHNK